MGRYVSVRGWIECTEEQFLNIEDIISKFKKKYKFYKMDKEGAELYQKGWLIQKEPINWTSYVFYGADIREYYLNFIKDQLIEIAKLDKEIEAYFFVDDEENISNYNWKFIEGKLCEVQRTNCSL